MIRKRSGLAGERYDLIFYHALLFQPLSKTLLNILCHWDDEFENQTMHNEQRTAFFFYFCIRSLLPPDSEVFSDYPNLDKAYVPVHLFRSIRGKSLHQEPAL